MQPFLSLAVCLWALPAPKLTFGLYGGSASQRSQGGLVGAGSRDAVLDGHCLHVGGLRQLLGAAGRVVEQRGALHPALSCGVAG